MNRDILEKMKIIVDYQFGVVGKITNKYAVKVEENQRKIKFVFQ